MAPKKDKGGKKSSQGTDLVPDEPLQALVLTDSYEPNFKPLTIESPRCLLPLANTPLIEYTLEFLATTGVGEVYLACCAHSERIREYILKSKWNSPIAPFEVHILSLPESSSVGDVLRDVDSKGIMKGDFLLISGDVVCNIDFKKVLASHLARKQTDRNAIMTMVLRESGPLHRTRTRSNPEIFILDAKDDRCLRYETASLMKSTRDKVRIDAELLTSHENISARNDLIDCHIDICTPDVPALFQENFDYDTIRTDFVRGILTSDLLGKTIYTHILDKHYAARVQDVQTYDAVSRDVIARYSYPITPESNLIYDHTYSYQRGHIYKEDGVVLAQSCSIGTGTVIGTQTRVGADTSIKGSVVGRDCQIGINVIIEDSYIWNNVVIEDNTVIRGAIVADGAIIKSGVEIEPKSIISFGVVIGSNVKLPAGVRLTTSPITEEELSDEDDDDESGDETGRLELAKSKLENGHNFVGKDGKGRLYLARSSDRDDDEEGTGKDDSLDYQMSYLNLSDSSITSTKALPRRRRRSRAMSAASDMTMLSEDAEEENFIKEAIASVDRSIMDHHEQSIALLELNTLRMTMNAPHEEVRTAVSHSLVAHVNRLVKTDTLDVKTATENTFGEWSLVLSRIVFEPLDQVDLLNRLQEDCAKTLPLGAKILFYAASTMYDKDVVSEESIYEWADSDQSSSTDDLKRAKELTDKWVEWLREAEEESE